jgi:hypothetical protein
MIVIAVVKIKIEIELLVKIIQSLNNYRNNNFSGNKFFLNNLQYIRVIFYENNPWQSNNNSIQHNQLYNKNNHNMANSSHGISNLLCNGKFSYHSLHCYVENFYLRCCVFYG